MRSILSKVFIGFFFVLACFLAQTHVAFADDSNQFIADAETVHTTIIPISTNWDGTKWVNGVPTNLASGEDILSKINDRDVHAVLIIFSGLRADTDYSICPNNLDQEDSFLGNLCLLTPDQQSDAFFHLSDLSIKIGPVKNPYDKSTYPNAIEVLVCGDGKSKLFAGKECFQNGNVDYDGTTGLPKSVNTKHYFWGGSIYHFRLYKTSPKPKGLVADASFYVNHWYPNVYVAAGDKSAQYHLVATEVESPLEPKTGIPQVVNYFPWTSGKSDPDKDSIQDQDFFKISSAQDNLDNVGTYQIEAHQFEPGPVYDELLAEQKANDGNDPNIVYDDHSNPNSTIIYDDISLYDQLTPPQAIGVKLGIQKSGGIDRNGYQVELVGIDNGYYDSQCTQVTDGKLNSKVANDPLIVFGNYHKVKASALSTSTSGNGELVPGQYELRVHEGAFLSFSKYLCSGGFTYWKIPITIKKVPSVLAAAAGKSVDLYRVLVGEPIQDPDETDYTNSRRLGVKTTAPCAKFENTLASPKCMEFDVSFLGQIATDPRTFVTSIFTIILSLSGAIAIILMIVAGYQLMISQGDKQKLQAARERITSLIIGLVFIIFSLVILQIIAAKILLLPGFG